LSLVRPAAGQSARFVVIHDLPPLPGPAQAFAASTRNRSFLIAAGDDLSLRFGTTARERWHAHLPYRPACIALSQKYERFAVLGEDGRLHRFLLDDPHPESGLTSLFSRIWYEGGSAPEWKWQSSGGADSEPKLSMMPLLFGTLKGTFYAVLFAVPLALLAAIYSAEFMHPRFKAVIKPTLELMASLPSVVLGFLAALWLAPILDERVPSLLLVAILVPASAMGFGWWWARLPMRIRSAIAPGYEFLAYLPILAIVGSAAWALGPLLEATVFTVRDPRTGLSHGSFPAWWHQVTGDSYEGHNCLVVGLMMGFAVMPLIFTIAEDALSNVPANLRSGSLALGASRWQTAFRVVIPTASAGIFSGLMIGIGRAIGETMIVVMATGNTPLMDINIFDGMRTISATIATELPEADQGGTLYRTLFFGALLLFLMTFVINTAAELLRQHLREKYKTV
jgi:phosphate transport system permease protein